MCYLPQTPKGFYTLFRQEFLLYFNFFFYSVFKNINHNLLRDSSASWRRRRGLCVVDHTLFKERMIFCQQ